MKHSLVAIICILALCFSCRNNEKEVEQIEKYAEEEELDVTTSIYPENLTKVFDAHGGLETWQKQRTLEFTMAKEDGNEITTTDLKERYSLVEMPKHTMGFDGESVWMKSKDNAKYEGDPKFYYNLMFYFYAMPFVLADDGINYADVKPLEFEGKSYPGIKVTYESNIGTSPDDEYILYYNPETHKMEWLAYTVTYFDKQSDEFHFIKYSTWQEIDGLLLPETMVWYNTENNLPTTVKKEQKFDYVSLSEDKMNLKMYMMPEDAREIQ